jgi:undecaprenyl pyrophosphate synthase
MDESGDLGFNFTKKKTSKYFVVTFLFVENKKPIEKIVKTVFQGFTKRKIKHHSGTLHCYKESVKTRKKLLELLNTKDIALVTIYLNKKKVYTKLQDEKHILYNYVTNILLDRVFSKKILKLSEPIKLIASKRETNKFLDDNFRSYLEEQTKNNHKHKISVKINFPHEEKCL